MTRKSGFRNTTSSVPKCAGVVCAVVCILLIANKHDSARSKLDTYNLEVQGWEACRRTNPNYFAACKEAVSLSQKNLDEAQGNFWINLPKAQLAGLLVLVASGSGTGGYFVTWAVLWFGGLGVFQFIRPIYANQVRECPSVIGTKSAHCEQDRQGFRGLVKGCFAHVSEERGKLRYVLNGRSPI